jgi:hypothetical protein
VPRVDVSGWNGDAVAEQVERLRTAGAEPAVTTTLSWLSAAERSQRDQDLADAARCAVLRANSVKGANRVRHQR